MQRVISNEQHPVKIWASDLEPEAEVQVRNVAKMPFIFKHVAVMPDAHAGKGSTVGTVIATEGALLPSAIGVDIGCGMCAVQLPFKVDVFGDRISALRSSIERSVPVGHHANREINERAQCAMLSLGKVTEVTKKHVDMDRAAKQIGTLGTGNHFIEICADQDNNAWVLLHSGSRNIGKCLAEIHIEKAKGIMKQYFIDLPHEDLAYLVQGTPEFEFYMKDLLWAQDYAKYNRNEMMTRILKDISFHVWKADKGADFMTKFRVDCHHNFAQMENHYGRNVWVTRKGAVSARAGQWGIIPGSMGTRSYIVKGKGNPESFCSCSHGAGRKMSRTKAQQVFTVEDLKEQTKGVECRKDGGVIDEIPGAYKDIDTVMANQADLVEPEFTLKQILCIKG